MPVTAYSAVRPLLRQSHVALVAPAGPLRDQTDLDRAIENVRLFGWEPVVGEYVLANTGYLAGNDAQRIDDLNRAIRDDHIDAIWCLRGGYGVMRILEAIDYDAFSRSPKAIIGYSDITALHAAIAAKCQIITYHGPTARSVITAFSRNSFERAVIFGEDSGGVAHSAHTVCSGVATGRLMGGNLALLAALVGTPFFPDLRGAILVLEDVNEPLYRIDRMLQQLRLSGALAQVAAIGFGQCTSCEGADTTDSPQSLRSLLREIAQPLNIPCVVGLPIGHIDEQWTLPLGALATLDADATTLTVLRNEDH